RPKSSRSVTATTAAATSSVDGRRDGVLDETTPSMTARPESMNSATSSRSAASSVATSTDTAAMLLRCNTFHGNAVAQLCTDTSAPAAATQVSSNVVASVSSIGATGLSVVTPARRPATAAGTDGSAE